MTGAKDERALIRRAELSATTEHHVDKAIGAVARDGACRSDHQVIDVIAVDVAAGQPAPGELAARRADEREPASSEYDPSTRQKLRAFVAREGNEAGQPPVRRRLRRRRSAFRCELP